MIKLMKFLKPYRKQLALGLIFIVIQAMSNLGLPTLTSNLINVGVLQKDIPYIVRQGLVMLGVALLNIVAVSVVSFISARVAQGFGRDIRKAVFETIGDYSLNEMDQFSTASLITRTTNDVQQVQMATVMSYRMMLIAPIMGVGAIILAIGKQPKLSIIFLIMLPLLMLAISRVAKKGTPLFKKVQEKIDRLNLVLREELTGVRVIRAYNKENYEDKRFLQASNDLRKTTLDVNFIMATTLPIITLIISATQVIIVWWGGSLVDADAMKLGDIIAFIQYAMQILTAFMMISTVFILFPRASVSAGRINEVLSTPIDIKDVEHPEAIPSNHTNDLVFDHVSFAYPEAEEPVLKDISFVAARGKKTAIIGSTGSGKSSILNLIERFYDIQKGEILFEGVNIAKMSQAELREHIGYVPQKNLLFSGTIADNIRYGKADASIEEVKAAAKIAQADDFIMADKDGYDRMITQGGTNVSGGQRQRLAIARALVRKPDILLFDDSFSALDYETDSRLRAALEPIVKNTIYIVVAQRISSIMDADQIIVLDQGRIDAIGTHEELLKKSPVYKEIALSQLSEEELA